MTDIIFRIVGDSTNTPQVFAAVDKSMQGLQRTQANTAAGMASLNRSTALTRQEMMALNYTASDVAASLASGASPFTILLQQGGQVKDAFGGLGPLFGKLSAAISPMAVVAGAAAAALGSVAVASYQGWQESNRLAVALYTTRNAAGLTTASFVDMARRISEATGTPVSAARTALLGLASTGDFTRTSVEAVGKSIVLLAKVTGESEEDIVKRYGSMRAGVTKWALEANKSYGFLTPEVLRHVRALESQGKTQQAMLAVADAINQRYGTEMPRQLGYLEKAWKGIGDMASWAWDRMLNVGRAETAAGKIDAMRKQLADVTDELEKARERRKNGKAGQSEVDALEAGQKRLQTWLAANAEAGKKGAQEQAADTEANNKALEEMSVEHYQRMAGIQQSQILSQQRVSELSRGKERIEIERQYREQETTAVQYVNSINALDRKALAAKEATINAELELERRRPVSTKDEAAQQQARLLEIESRRAEVALERAQLEERIRTGTNVTNLDRGPERNTAQQQLNKLEREQTAAIEQSYTERRLLAGEYYRDLVAGNKQLGIDLIQDDRQRGMAQIAQDEKIIRQRLDLDAMAADERRRAEDELATWRALREKQLTEQLKPEWQRQLESYRDINRLMRDSFDTTMNRLTSAGEDAWVEFTRTGKLSVKNLVNIINDELARVQWRKYLAQPASNIFQGILGFFGLNSSGGAAGAGDVAGGGFKAPAGFSLGGVQGHIGGVFGMGGGTPRSIPAGLLAGAPRFHSGGLAVDEMPAVLRKGEEVLTRNDPRHVLNGGGQGGLSVTNNFHVPPGTSPAAYAGMMASQLKASEDRIYAQMLRPGSRMRRAARAA